MNNNEIPVVTTICPACNGAGECEYPSPCKDASSMLLTCVVCNGRGVVVKYTHPKNGTISYTRVPV